mmetsp:Transcript_20462/g.65511  ORF Transcript_20462/g.65511 Transcript_20462/m.65511 type:complete len:296 (-) Transcript_20462:44-931(-)
MLTRQAVGQRMVVPVPVPVLALLQQSRLPKGATRWGRASPRSMRARVHTRGGPLAGDLLLSDVSVCGKDMATKSDEIRKSGLPAHVYDYLLAHNRDDDLLRRLREETKSTGRAMMQSAPEQGQFLAMLAKLMGARRCLEIGCFTGYSSLSVARVLPSDGLLVTLDVSDEWTSIAKKFWREAGVEGIVDLRLGPATESLQKMVDAGEAGTFDFAFIDADKTGYAAYVEMCHTLLRTGGLLVIDNTLWDGRVTDPEAREREESTAALHKLNEALLVDERWDLSFLGIADGVTLLLKR